MRDNTNFWDDRSQAWGRNICYDLPTIWYRADKRNKDIEILEVILETPNWLRARVKQGTTYSYREYVKSRKPNDKKDDNPYFIITKNKKAAEAWLNLYNNYKG